MLKLRKNKKGFTLVELIVVIAIMAVLAGTVAGVTVSQLNKQTNNTAQNEVNTLMEDFKTFLLDYRLPSEPDTTTITGFTKVVAQWTPDNGIDTANELTYAVMEFAADAKATKGSDVLTQKPTGQNATLPKAGTHKFVFEVETSSGKLKVTFSCAKKGSSGSDPTATYEYKDVLAG